MNELYKTSWQFTSSAVPDRWDSTVRHVRRLRATTEGLDSIRISTSRPDTWRALGFDGGDPPFRQIVDWHRGTGIGTVLLEEAPSTPSTFRQRVRLDPPLTIGETLEFQLETRFTARNFAFAEDLLEATSGSEQRSHDYVSVNVVNPTDLLELEVVIPEELQAQPRGIEVVIRGEPHEGERNRAFAGFQHLIDTDGALRERFSIGSPRLGAKYRLSWFLPTRP